MKSDQIIPKDLEHILGQYDLLRVLKGRINVEPTDHPRILEYVGRKRLRVLGVKLWRSWFISPLVYRAVGDDRLSIESLKKQVAELKRSNEELTGKATALEGEVKRLRKEGGTVMDWKDVGGKLLNLGLPLVGTVLGGPVGAGTGSAIARTISGLLGVEPDNPQAAYDLISADPNAVMELRKYEMQHREELQRIALEQERLHLQSQQTRASIVRVEAQGESWLQRNWRPMLMVAIMAIVVNNYILFPYVSAFTDKVKMLDLPDGLWALLNVGVGGYVVGRSAEKILSKKREA